MNEPEMVKTGTPTDDAKPAAACTPEAVAKAAACDKDAAAPACDGKADGGCAPAPADADKK